MPPTPGRDPYTAGAAPPPVWSRPDPALAAAGVEGELVVARVRVFAMTLLMIAPTWNILHYAHDPIHVTGFAVTLTATIASFAIWLALRHGRWRPWIAFASSAFDVTMVSTALASFLVVGSPMVALNSKVTFEMYFLAITATSLRYDARVCIAAGLLAVAQYGGLWAFAASRFDLHAAEFVAAAGPYLPVDIWTRLILLGIATVLAVTLVRRAQRLLYLAARDRLTGVFNRGHFDRAIANAMEVATRSGDPLSLVILDIDWFKRINDEHGHASGDLAIRAVADRLSAAMRRTDTVARYGGEEFVVLMPGITPDAALERIEALRQGLAAERLELGNGHALTIGFSAGVAGWPHDHEQLEPDTLLGCADQRLLEAKRAGRGRCLGPAPRHGAAVASGSTLALLALLLAGPAAAAAQTADVPANDTVAIETATGTLLSLDVSPDSRTIVFDLLGQLWELPARGGAANAITDAVRDTAYDLDPAFAPDGRTIAFTGERAGRRGLWLLGRDGGGPRLLAELPHPFASIGAPAWSPDGSRIAVGFVPPPSAGLRPRRQLAVVDVATGALRPLEITGPSTGARGHAWTPDGRLVFFAASAAPVQYELWSVAAEGGEAVRLGPAHPRALAPAVAPDGRHVAYLAADSAGVLQVWVSGLAPGAAPRAVTRDGGVAPTRVRWAPDGRAVYYSAAGEIRRTEVASGATAAIPFTARLALPRALTALPPARFPAPGDTAPARGFMGLALSPDAGRIAVLALGRLWVARVGEGAVRVADVPLTARHLTWSPDGAEVAWSAGPNEHEDLFATDVRTGTTRRVTALRGRELLPAWSPDGRWIALLHADSAERVRIVPARGSTVHDVAEARPLAEASADWTGSVATPLAWSPRSDAVLQVGGSAPGQPTTGLLASLAGDTARITLPDAPVFAAWTGDSLVYVRHDRLWTAPIGPGGTTAAAVPLGDAPALYLSAAADGTLLFVSRHGLRLRTPAGVERSLGWPVRYAPPVPPPLLVRNVRIVDGTGAPATAPSDLLVEQGRIARIAPAGTIAAAGARVLDGGGGWMIPGLMDLHAHVYLPELLPGFAAFGVTVVRDQGAAIAPLAAWAEAIASGAVQGPRVSHGGFQFYSDWPYDEEQGRGVEPEADSAHLSRALDLAAAFGAHHVKIRTFRRWDIAARLIRGAHARGMRTTGHCAAPLPLIAAGVDAQEHVGFCPIRGEATTAEAMRQYDDVNRLLQAAGVAVVPTISYLSFGARINADSQLIARDTALAPYVPGLESFGWMLEMDAAEREQDLAAVREQRRTTARLAALGVTLGTGTDIWQVPAAVHYELEELVAAGLTPAAAIRAATADAARIVGTDQLGTIAVGRLADLVLLDADPLADIRNTRRIRAVVKGGEVVDAARLPRAGQPSDATSAR